MGDEVTLSPEVEAPESVRFRIDSVT